MTTLTTYERKGQIARITMNDGNLNIMSSAMLEDLHAAFTQAEAEKAVVLLCGEGRAFSAGFDLKVFASGDEAASRRMLHLGATLALKLLSFPFPIVAACHGNTFPMGAFLLLASDLRIGAAGPYKIGLNEVAIGLTLPLFATELARHRLTPAYFNRAAVTGEMFAPEEAAAAGFLDMLAPPDELMARAEHRAASLAQIDLAAHAATKLRVRGAAIEAVTRAIETELPAKAA